MRSFELGAWAIVYSIILFSPIIICLILHYKRIIPALLELWKELKSSFYWKSLLKIQIICIFLVGAFLMAQAFNGCVPYFTPNTFISQDMSDWGDFATCLTAVFALISIFYAYRAFRIQTISTDESLKQARTTLNKQSWAAMKASFDATFTQMFVQHNTLRERLVRHKISIGVWSKYICNMANKRRNVFSVCRKEYEIKHMLMSVDKFWEDFNDRIGLEVSIDFKNYFKYIYHEINIVVSQPNEVLNNNARQNYVQLIQAQMNYDELFCYFINQVEYLIHWRKLRSGRIPDNVVRHAENLRCYKFFEELCRSRSGHVPLIRNVMEKHRFEVLMLINDDWFY